MSVESCLDSVVARARVGSLSAAERGQLHRHLLQCEKCRVSLFIGRDFDQALAAQAGDTALLSRVASRVRTARQLSRNSARPSARPPLRRRWLGYMLVAAVLMGAVAAAETRPARRAWDRLLNKAEVLPATPTAIAAPPPTSAPATEPIEAPLVSTPAASITGEPHSRAPSRSVKSEPPSANDLFTQANATRRAGDDSAARHLYVELQERYPSSPEAQVSCVSLGRLLLERAGDPSGALAQFDRFLAHPSTAQPALAEDALFGRATALMQLGRSTEERQTWNQLLARFPGSVYADRARGRLRTLR